MTDTNECERKTEYVIAAEHDLVRRRDNRIHHP
jgi:hypothetical protein